MSGADKKETSISGADKKIAVFGGTFDPIHLGHLLIAEQACREFSLDRVFFMPAGDPPHKTGREITDGGHRLAMVKLAISDNPCFSFADYELNKEGYSYTADTMRHYYQSDLAGEIFFLMGADSLTEIYSWKEPQFLLREGCFIVARRPDFPLESLLEEPGYRPYRENILVMESLMIDISSSAIRRSVQRGLSIRYQTRDEVIAYIEENGLYRGD